MPTLRKEWGANIIRGRKFMGLSQADLARKLGLTQATVSRWESGTCAPRDKHKVEIASALRQDVTALFPLPRALAS